MSEVAEQTIHAPYPEPDDQDGGVDLTVPRGTAAKVKPHTVLGGVDADNGWESREGGYWNSAAVAGATPVISVDANISLSGLKLISS